jgi:hypothetical protein
MPSMQSFEISTKEVIKLVTQIPPYNTNVNLISPSLNNHLVIGKK